ncbi:hypothetical protein BG262_01115 [Floricoccus penangensis]|uniref:DUF5640 domain-containing protein n=1 Tax=Floricoccus penangensis TaxID=1859475 RepID=A0A9Q5P1D6_9LACT|nr:hypothetical protein [Floricoccus penangensis]OFI47255.1 hypothetical protein BG262_01115 [Floricoccus penangensis]
MKKTITALLTATALLTLVGCGSNKKDTTSNSTTKSSSTNVSKKVSKKSEVKSEQNNSSSVASDTSADSSEVNTNNTTSTPPSETSNENKQSEFPFDNILGYWKNSDGQYITFKSNYEKTFIGYGKLPGQSADGIFNISDAKIDGNTISSKLENGIGDKNTITITSNGKDNMTLSFNDGETWNLVRTSQEEIQKSQPASEYIIDDIIGTWNNSDGSVVKATVADNPDYININDTSKDFPEGRIANLSRKEFFIQGDSISARDIIGGDAMSNNYTSVTFDGKDKATITAQNGKTYTLTRAN